MRKEMGGSVRYDTQGILAYEAPVEKSVWFPGPLNPENKLIAQFASLRTEANSDPQS